MNRGLASQTVEDHMRGLQRAGVGMALIGLMLAGCGGNDDPGASATEGDAQATITTPPSEETSPATEGFCAEVEGIRDRLENLDSLPDAADPQAAIATFEDSIEALRSVEPPAEIAEDWSTVTEAFDDVVTGLKGLDTSDPEVLAGQLEDLGNQMEQQSAAIDEAGSNIDQYLKDECGFTFD